MRRPSASWTRRARTCRRREAGSTSARGAHECRRDGRGTAAATASATAEQGLGGRGCPGRAATTGRPVVARLRRPRTPAGPGPAAARRARAASAAPPPPREDLVAGAGVGRHEPAHVLDHARPPGGSPARPSPRPAAPRAARRAAGVVTMTSDAVGSSWASESATSPVPGRQVDQQVVGLVPPDLGDEARERLVEHRAAPDDRAVLLGEEADRHQPHAVRLDRHHQVLDHRRRGGSRPSSGGWSSRRRRRRAAPPCAPRAASATARLAVMLDLPTPPLPEAMPMTRRAAAGAGRARAAPGRRRGPRRSARRSSSVMVSIVTCTPSTPGERRPRASVTRRWISAFSGQPGDGERMATRTRPAADAATSPTMPEVDDAAVQLGVHARRAARPSPLARRRRAARSHEHPREGLGLGERDAPGAVAGVDARRRRAPRRRAARGWASSPRGRCAGSRCGRCPGRRSGRRPGPRPSVSSSTPPGSRASARAWP